MLYQTLPKRMLNWLIGSNNKNRLPPFADELGDLLRKYCKDPKISKDYLIIEMSIWICCLMLYEENPEKTFEEFHESIPHLFEKCLQEKSSRK